MKSIKIGKDELLTLALAALSVPIGILFFKLAAYANFLSGTSGRGLTSAFAPFSEEWCKFTAVVVVVILTGGIFKMRLSLKEYLIAGFWVGFAVGFTETASAILNPANGPNIIIERIPGTILHIGTPILMAYGVFLFAEQRKAMVILILPLMIIAHATYNYLVWPWTDFGFVARMAIALGLIVPAFVLIWISRKGKIEMIPE